MPNMTWKDIEVSELSEQDKRYMVMYGCTQDDMVCMMNDPMNFIGGHYMLAMSILSDAQECIERGMDETARQYINRAKYVLREWNND
jgi:hypothetical protein